MKITEVLVAEHAAFSSVFDQIEHVLPNLTSLSEVKILTTLVEGLLRGHGGTERELAYVALDHALLEHKGALDHFYQDHHEVDAHFKRVREAKDFEEARRLFKAALHASREHFNHEERTVFPLIEKVLHGDTLAELGSAWRQRYEASTALGNSPSRRVLKTVAP